MTEANDIERVIRVLKTVPEKSLLIIEVANEVATENGEVDYDKLIDRQREVNLAVAEAKAYSQATHKAIHALWELPARRGEADVGP